MHTKRLASEKDGRTERNCSNPFVLLSSVWSSSVTDDGRSGSGKP